MMVDFKVTVNGQEVEKVEEEEVNCTLDVLLKTLHNRWGVNCDIHIHVWRANWSA